MSMLSPSPKFSATYVDADGFTKPAAGYKLYSYAAGTSTPKSTYTNYTLGASNANPTILDARGEATVFLSGNYKFILTDDADNTIWTVDNVNDLETGATFTTATLAGALTVTSTAVTWSGNPTHSGNHTFSGAVSVQGNVTIGDAGADSLTVNPNAVTWANNPTHSGNHTWSGTQTFSVTPGGKIAAGTYTPTAVLGTNADVATPEVASYIRIGDTVFVSGFITIDPAAAGATNTLVTLSLPIASNLANYYECTGVGSDATAGTANNNSAATIYGDTGANKAVFSFHAGSAASAGWAYQFMYIVI